MPFIVASLVSSVPTVDEISSYQRANWELVGNADVRFTIRAPAPVVIDRDGTVRVPTTKYTRYVVETRYARDGSFESTILEGSSHGSADRYILKDGSLWRYFGKHRIMRTFDSDSKPDITINPFFALTVANRKPLLELIAEASGLPHEITAQDDGCYKIDIDTSKPGKRSVNFETIVDPLKGWMPVSLTSFVGGKRLVEAELEYCKERGFVPQRWVVRTFNTRDGKPSEVIGEIAAWDEKFMFGRSTTDVSFPAGAYVIDAVENRSYAIPQVSQDSPRSRGLLTWFTGCAGVVGLFVCLFVYNRSKGIR